MKNFRPLETEFKYQLISYSKSLLWAVNLESLQFWSLFTYTPLPIINILVCRLSL